MWTDIEPGMLDEQVDVRIDDQVIMRLQRGRAHNAEWRKKREARKKAGRGVKKNDFGGERR